jgi:hypothetical protein
MGAVRLLLLLLLERAGTLLPSTGLTPAEVVQQRVERLATECRHKASGLKGCMHPSHCQHMHTTTKAPQLAVKRREMAARPHDT